jgi:MFS family permease
MTQTTTAAGEGKRNREGSSRWKQTLRAFQSRNYRLYFTGQGISLIGTWMQRIAMSWLVYRLTDSAFMLGLVGFLSALPAFLFSPFAGVIADRYDRRPMLITVHSLALLQALILSLIVLAEVVTIWHILILGLLLGLVEALEMPLRLSFLSEIVSKQNMGNAIALNSSMVNASRLVGPSLAGILIAWMGEGVCFLLNSISYLGVICSLLMMRVSPVPKPTHRSRILKELQDGFAYAYSFTPIRDMLLLLGLMSLVAMPYTVLMPVFAKDVLQGGPHTLGFLLGASGVGALLGAIYLASRKSVLGLTKWIPIGALLFGGTLLLFALSHLFWLSLLLMLVSGFGMIVQLASSNTLIQTIVAEDKRGRVMSLFVMAWRGMVPFGSLLAGLMASRMGAPLTLAVGGVCCIAGGLWFGGRLPAMGRQIQPLYQQLGILADTGRTPKNRPGL